MEGFLGIFMFFPIIMFVLVFGIIIFTLVTRAKQWNKNNNSPRLSVEASVVAKRMDISHSSSRHRQRSNMYSHTTYYATFEVPSGDRMELQVGDYEYGMLVEGDRGTLHFQGTRFLGFDRQ